MFTRTLIKKGVGITVGTISIVATGFVSQDEGSQRSLKFWVNIFPLYAHYRFIQFLSRDTGLISYDYANDWYEVLHEKYTDRVKDLTYEMRGKDL